MRGDGAYLIMPEARKRLEVSRQSKLTHSLLSTGFPYDRQTSPHNNTREVVEFIKVAQGVRRPGCAALDMAYVAAGRIDGYWEYKLYVWDMAAGRLIIEESGGRFSQPDGKLIEMDERLSVLASNGAIHDQMLHVLSAAKKEREYAPHAGS